MVGVKLSVCAKIISVGDGNGDSDSDKETAGEGDIGASVGDGVGVGVGVVGDGDKVTVGLRVGVRKTTIVGLTDASLRKKLFFFIKIKTKRTTIIVNKEIIKKINLE